MTIHNTVLVAAAISGITAGVLDSTDYSQITSTVLGGIPGALQQATQISALALAIDQAIPSDASLSVGATGISAYSPLGATALFPAAADSGVIVNTWTKPLLLAKLCESAFRGRSLTAALTPTGTVSSVFAGIIAGIAAVYAATIAESAWPVT
jgi:hypothetical protein